MKRNRKQGFTLMEMLIVVAIIAILIAIAIPTFVKQLEKARETTDASNIRSAFSELSTAYLDDGRMYIKRVHLSQKDLTSWVSTSNSNKKIMTIGGVDVDIGKIVTSESDSAKAHLVPYINILIDSEGNLFVAANGFSAPLGDYYDLDLKKYDFGGRLVK